MRAPLKTWPVTTAPVGRSQARPGGGEPAGAKAAGGAPGAWTGRLGALWRRPGVSARCDFPRPGIAKCLSGFMFFVRCWRSLVLTSKFYPEIMILILGKWSKKTLHCRSFTVHHTKVDPTLQLKLTPVGVLGLATRCR